MAESDKTLPGKLHQSLLGLCLLFYSYYVMVRDLRYHLVYIKWKKKIETSIIVNVRRRLCLTIYAVSAGDMHVAVTEY